MTEAQEPNQFVATDSKGLYDLGNFIHDEFFDLNDIKYESSTKVLEIPYGRCFHTRNSRKVRERILWRVYEVPVLRSILRICNVLSYELVDTAKVGRYDFNSLRYCYNEYGSTIVVETGVPLDFRILVSDLYVEYSEVGYRGRAELASGWFPIPWNSGPKFLEW